MNILQLILIIAALVLGIVGAWAHSARLVGIGVTCAAGALLIPAVD